MQVLQRSLSALFGQGPAKFDSAKNILLVSSGIMRTLDSSQILLAYAYIPDGKRISGNMPHRKKVLSAPCPMTVQPYLAQP
jgi:hypothetical protein